MGREDNLQRMRRLHIEIGKLLAFLELSADPTSFNHARASDRESALDALKAVLFSLETKTRELHRLSEDGSKVIA